MLTKSRRAVYFMLSIFIIIAGLPLSTATATDDPLPVDQTSINDIEPVLVTSYRYADTSMTDFDFIELYNSGDKPVNIRDVTITDISNMRIMRILALKQGYVLPDSHVLVAYGGMVNAELSYQLDGWDNVIPAPAAITKLRVSMPGYRSSDTSIKLIASKTLIDSGFDFDSLFGMRTYGVSSYNTGYAEQYRTLFDDDLYIPPFEPNDLEVSEVYAYASDCDPFSIDTRCGDYIELHNTSGGAMTLDDLVLRTDSSSSSRTSSNTFALSGELEPDEYLYVDRTDDGARISLTNSGGYIWLEDTWGLEMPFMNTLTSWPSFSSDQQGISYSRDDIGTWRWTTAPTPGFVNDIVAPVEVVAACPAGKYRNPDTGKCRAIEEAVSELSSCEEGYERNPLTNRCKKLASATSATLTPCLEGQERNPATNRCRSIASAVAELMPCDEGYERNPTTNRCRKSQSTSVPAAPFAVEPTSAGMPVWQWLVGGAIVTALAGYGVWEWRHDLMRAASRVFKKRT